MEERAAESLAQIVSSADGAGRLSRRMRIVLIRLVLDEAFDLRVSRDQRHFHMAVWAFWEINVVAVLPALKSAEDSAATREWIMPAVEPINDLPAGKLETMVDSWLQVLD